MTTRDKKQLIKTSIDGISSILVFIIREIGQLQLCDFNLIFFVRSLQKKINPKNQNYTMNIGELLALAFHIRQIINTNKKDLSFAKRIVGTFKSKIQFEKLKPIQSGKIAEPQIFCKTDPFSFRYVYLVQMKNCHCYCHYITRTALKLSVPYSVQMQFVLQNFPIRQSEANFKRPKTI